MWKVFVFCHFTLYCQPFFKVTLAKYKTFSDLAFIVVFSPAVSFGFICCLCHQPYIAKVNFVVPKHWKMFSTGTTERWRNSNQIKCTGLFSKLTAWIVSIEKAQVLITTLTMSLLYSSVPVWRWANMHNTKTLEPKQINFITYTCAFPTMTCHNGSFFGKRCCCWATTNKIHLTLHGCMYMSIYH